MKAILTILAVILIILTAFTVMTYTHVIWNDLIEHKKLLRSANELTQTQAIQINIYKQKIAQQTKIITFCQKNIK